MQKKEAAIDNEMLKRLGHTNDQLYEEEIAKSEMENEEPIIVRFFILY